MRKSLAIASAAALAVAGIASQAGADISHPADSCDATNFVGSIPGDDPGSAADGVPSNITTDTTWDGTICLSEPAFVQDGVTLTILPGTLVRGQTRRDAPGAVDGTPGALIITQGGKIDAEGTASDPIIMTTAAVDNNGDGICDDGNGDGWFDPYPGYQDIGTCIADGTCTTAEALGSATFCDATPKTTPMPPLAADGTANLSEWGGLVLEGRAPINVANQSGTPMGHGGFFVEGLQLPGFDPTDAQCGGVEPHDSSGIVRYVSVRHGGDEIGFGNELNGVTMCGVGDGTDFGFVEIYSNFDDGIEFFGGTANIDHMVFEYAGDDSLDIDLGYTGTVQFAFAVMPFFDQDDGSLFGSKSGNKIGEWDGDDYAADDPPLQSNVNVRTAYSAAVFPLDPLAFAIDSRDTTPWPLSGPFVANYTGIGNTPDGANPAVHPAAPSANEHMGIQWRNGFAGQVANSAIVNTAGQSPDGACLVVDTSTAKAPAGHDAVDHVNLGISRWITSSCDDSDPMNASPGAANDAANNGDAYSAIVTHGLACAVNIRSTGGGFTGLVQEDPTFDPKDWSTVTLKYDPRPKGPGADCGITLPPPFDQAATYRGAFPPNPGTELWTTGWTVLNLAGVLAN